MHFYRVGHLCRAVLRGCVDLSSTVQSLCRSRTPNLEFGEITQNKGYYVVQGHLGTPISVPTDSVSLAQNFRYKGSSSTNHSSCQKIRWMDLLYGTIILAVDYFVLSQSTRLRDRRTDRQKDDSKTARMHSQSHGNELRCGARLSCTCRFV